MAKCNRCNRPLTDAKSIKIGMGPVCRKKAFFDEEEEARQSVFSQPRFWPYSATKIPETIPRRTYELTRIDDNPVIIVSQGKHSHDLRHIAYHSPCGMEFGYGGSGPSDCARSILVDLAGFEVADTYYMDFKWEFIVKIDQETGGKIDSRDIHEWLLRKEAEA